MCESSEWGRCVLCGEGVSRFTMCADGVGGRVRG